MESLQKQLEQKGIRPSYHRLKILKYLDAHRTHPTVDIIYEALRKELPTISKTTIYNTLTLLLENGLISHLTISGNDVRYDAEAQPHSHFQCKKCNEVYDIEEVKCPHVKKGIAGNQVDEVHLYFKGTCKECIKRSK
jgi:Fe2+ or Zn2+ uptake regulation protein